MLLYSLFSFVLLRLPGNFKDNYSRKQKDKWVAFFFHANKHLCLIIALFLKYAVFMLLQLWLPLLCAVLVQYMYSVVKLSFLSN